MAQRGIRLAGVTVDTGRACPLDGSLVGLASGALRLRMRRTCREADVAWVSQVAMLERVAVNLVGVAGASVRRILQLVLSARTGVWASQ